jgi:hypothetical protein
VGTIVYSLLNFAVQATGDQSEQNCLFSLLSSLATEDEGTVYSLYLAE